MKRSKHRPKKDNPRMSEPRAYDLSQQGDVLRLFSELYGYMRISLTDGTDVPGRAHAFAALAELNTHSGRNRMWLALVRDENDVAASPSVNAATTPTGSTEPQSVRPAQVNVA